MDIVRAKPSRSLAPQNLAILNSQLNLIAFWTNPKKNCWSQPREGLFLGDGVGNLSFKEPLLAISHLTRVLALNLVKVFHKPLPAQVIQI